MLIPFHVDIELRKEIILGKTIHAFFSGAVQGVGFRYSVRALALGLNINGWVKNLVDGRVELIAGGDSQNLSNFLEKINQEFKENINDCLLVEDDETGKCIGFKIVGW